MYYEIRHCDDENTIIHSGEALSFRDFIQLAVRDKVDLSFADLSGFDLSRAVLRGARLFRANMDGCNLSLAALDDAIMSKATLRGANMTDASMSKTMLRGANMTRSNLSRADMYRANMERAKLVDADMSGSSLVGAILQGADMRRTNVEGTILAAVTREQPEKETHMYYEIKRRDDKNAIIHSGEALSFRDFIQLAVRDKVNLSYADLSGLDLSRADLTGAELYMADMDGCNLSGAILDDAIMTLASIRNATITGARMLHTDLTGTDLTGTDPSGAYMIGAKLFDMKEAIPVKSDLLSNEDPIQVSDTDKPNADTTTRESVLDAARAAVCGRGRAYGGPEESFSRISALWNTHLRNRCGEFQDLDTTDVAVMLLLLKVARVESTPDHVDSWVDMAGYAACGAECAGIKPTTEGETK